MRRRILQSTLAVVLLTALVLGLPLMSIAWLWVEDIERSAVRARLDRAASAVIALDERRTAGQPVDFETLRAQLPSDVKLVVNYPSITGSRPLVLGPSQVPEVLHESLTLGDSGTLDLYESAAQMHSRQRQVIGAVTLTIALAIGIGVAVAVLVARRLSGPLRDLSARAARIGKGEFRAEQPRFGIAELDRVSDVLYASAAEISQRLQRESNLVGDVSHQLRSRLTAVRLRLDELSTHPDHEVVAESEAAMAQVDRLTESIDELVRSLRSPARNEPPVVLIPELADVMAEWQPPFQQKGRRLMLAGDSSLSSQVHALRLREAVAVLVDNALVHGGGTCQVLVREVLGAVGHEPSICIEVSDEGPGVPRELAHHIFDRGISGSGSTGVGLNLARALVEADGGRLELQRRQPATFAIFLPIRNAVGVAASTVEPR